MKRNLYTEVILECESTCCFHRARFNNFPEISQGEIKMYQGGKLYEKNFNRIGYDDLVFAIIIR
jgi:hypothetical protein